MLGKVLRSAGLLGLICIVVGCPGNSAPTAHEPRLTQLVSYYGRYVGQNKGKPPANEQELKQFIQKVDPKQDVEKMFTSPRDGQPYVVRYNVKMPAGPATVFAYEQSGVNGKRLAAVGAGEVR